MIFMLETILFALISSVVVTLLIVPFSSKTTSKKLSNNILTILIVGVYLLSFAFIFTAAYTMKFDLNRSVTI